MADREQYMIRVKGKLVEVTPEVYYTFYRMKRQEEWQEEKRETIKFFYTVISTPRICSQLRTSQIKTLPARRKPDVVIFMGCNVSCPNVPSQYAENWGLDDPTGKSDEVFLETICQIEQKVLQLRAKLS